MGLLNIYDTDNKQDSSVYAADFTQFHTWIVDWTPDGLTICLDGKQIAKWTDKKFIPTLKHHIVFQSDMGSWAGKPSSSDPTRVEWVIDYVKQLKYVGAK